MTEEELEALAELRVVVANALKALGIGPTREGHEPIDWTQLPMEGDEE
jgi:hypothetical protein